MIKEFANDHDLSKPLDHGALMRFSLDELKTLKRILVERAVRIVGEIQSLESFSKFEKEQSNRGMFRCEIKLDSGEKVFDYSPEARFAENNIFVPGEWFGEYLEKLERLRAEKAKHTESYEDRNKEYLTRRLLGGRAKTEAAAA